MKCANQIKAVKLAFGYLCTTPAVSWRKHGIGGRGLTSYHILSWDLESRILTVATVPGGKLSNPCHNMSIRIICGEWGDLTAFTQYPGRGAMCVCTCLQHSEVRKACHISGTGILDACGPPCAENQTNSACSFPCVQRCFWSPPTHMTLLTSVKVKSQCPALMTRKSWWPQT